MFEMHSKGRKLLVMEIHLCYSKVIKHVYNHPKWFSVFGPCQLYHFGVVFGETETPSFWRRKGNLQQFVLETLPAGRGSNMCWELENKINSSRDHIFARAS